VVQSVIVISNFLPRQDRIGVQDREIQKLGRPSCLTV